MNIRIHAVCAAVLLSLLAGRDCPAQTPAAPPAPPVSAPPEPPKGGKLRDGMRERFVENLPPEIRQRFEAAREKALQDPKIQELKTNADHANEAFLKAMRDKMMEIDPGLGDLIKKEAKGWKDRRGGDVPGLANLNDDEKQKLMEAREKAKSDPAVQAADKKKQDATTPEERKAAGEAYRQAMREAILKNDPSMAPLLDKLGNKPAPEPPPGASASAPSASPAASPTMQ